MLPVPVLGSSTFAILTVPAKAAVHKPAVALSAVPANLQQIPPPVIS